MHKGFDLIERLIQQQHLRAERVGEWVLQLLRSGQRFWHVWLWTSRAFIRMRWLARPAVMHVVIRQFYFTGVQGLLSIVLIAALVGGLAVYNIAAFARSVQDLSLIGSLINSLLVQEIAPLMVTLFLLLRSGIAVITEIGHMQIRHEDRYLHSLGISLYEYIYMPRVLASALSGLILTFIFVLVSIWIGGLMLSWMYILNFNEFLLEVQRGTELQEVLAMFLKGMLYPMIACVFLIDQGRTIGTDPNQVPVRVSSGVLGVVMLLMVLMVVTDVCWSWLWSL